MQNILSYCITCDEANIFKYSHWEEIITLVVNHGHGRLVCLKLYMSTKTNELKLKLLKEIYKII